MDKDNFNVEKYLIILYLNVSINNNIFYCAQGSLRPMLRSAIAHSGQVSDPIWLTSHSKIIATELTTY